jgi:hypothetical protein
MDTLTGIVVASDGFAGGIVYLSSHSRGIFSNPAFFAGCSVDSMRPN